MDAWRQTWPPHGLGVKAGALSFDEVVEAVLDARQDALRAVCRDAFDAWIASIADELPWSDAAARRAFAEMLIAGLEGAFILGRTRRSGAPFITVGESLALMLERRPSHAGVRAGARSPRRRQRRSNKQG
jgi:hypothetical protein